jgi:hypothetical protein
MMRILLARLVPLVLVDLEAYNYKLDLIPENAKPKVYQPWVFELTIK